MRPSLKNTVQRIEFKYGKLGEAQHAMLEELFMEDSDITKRKIEDIWEIINRSLIDKSYTPLSERGKSMDDLFPSGDEFPDIYRGNISDIDMDDLL